MVPELERAVFGMYATHALRVAANHGIFAYLVERGAGSAPEIAATTRADEDTTERLLIVLDSFGVLRANNGRYEIPPAVRPYLDRRDSRYLGRFLDHLVTRTASRMPLLEQCLVNGKGRSETMPNPFDALYADPAAVEDFLAAMWQLSFEVSHELARLARVDTAHHLVDIGGGNGPFAVAALQAAPDLRATVFELLPVEPYLSRVRDEFGLEGRLSFWPGDFFRDDFPEGDCIALGYVLSDWTDDTCLDLLRKARRSCLPGGRVLVMERLFDGGKRGPLATAAMNLSMHVETQGRHRTASEYADLLQRAGFVDCEVHRSSRDKHLVIGHRGRRNARARSSSVCSAGAVST